MPKAIKLLCLCFTVCVQVLYAQSPISKKTREAYGKWINQAKTHLGMATHQKLLGKSYNPCEISFIRFFNKEGNKQIFGKNRFDAVFNLWDERFNPQHLIWQTSLHKNKKERLELLLDLTRFIHRDQTYVNNVALFATEMIKHGLLSEATIKRKFLSIPYENARFFYSKTLKKVTGVVKVDPKVERYLKQNLQYQNVSNELRKEYMDILLASDLTLAQLKVAFGGGMKLHNSEKHMHMFRKYIEFLTQSKDRKIVSGLKRVNKIYKFNYRHRMYTLDPLLPADKQFLAQESRLLNFEQRRVRELETFYKKENGGSLSSLMRTRAETQARGERGILRGMLNGCNSGKSQRVDEVSKTFMQIKMALGAGLTPVAYGIKNRETMDTDPFWWDKLGHELIMSIALAYAAGKIYGNPNDSMFKKYARTMIYEAFIDAPNAISYDALFGRNSYMTHIHSMLSGSDDKTELQKKFQELKKRPDLQSALTSLLDYLDAASKERSLKNEVNKVLKLSAYLKYGKDIDPSKVRAEDLESGEMRQVLMELLAEKLYLDNMGGLIHMQSGNHGVDRWLFNRTRDTVWNVKGMMRNIMIFQFLCRQPFGKAGSVAAAMSVQIFDTFFLGGMSYGLRREWINQ